MKKSLFRIGRKNMVSFLEKDALKSLILQNDKLLVVDVRDDDYSGSKVKNSVNYPSWCFEDKIDELIEDLKTQNISKVVFHCYYSQQRGPRCAKIFKGYTQEKNLNFEVFILSGGVIEWIRTFKNDPRLVEDVKK